MELLLKISGRKTSEYQIKAYFSIYCVGGWSDPEMAKKDTRLRQSIPVHKRVVVALWRLATGDTYQSTWLQFGSGRCMAMLIKQDFCKAIAKRAKKFIKFPEKEQEVLQSIRLFYKQVSISRSSTCRCN